MSSLIKTTFSELMREVGTWAARNFKVHAPDLGFAEECGEITHVMLKTKQGIRGYDNPAKTEADLKDAIADATIYFAHWCHINHIIINWPSSYHDYPEAKYPLGQLFHCAGEIVNAQPHDHLLAVANETLQELTDFAASLGWNLARDCVMPVWVEVRKRDWVRFPFDGMTR